MAPGKRFGKHRRLLRIQLSVKKRFPPSLSPAAAPPSSSHHPPLLSGCSHGACISRERRSRRLCRLSFTPPALIRPGLTKLNSASSGFFPGRSHREQDYPNNHVPPRAAFPTLTPPPASRPSCRGDLPRRSHATVNRTRPRERLRLSRRGRGSPVTGGEMERCFSTRCGFVGAF